MSGPDQPFSTRLPIMRRILPLALLLLSLLPPGAQAAPGDVDPSFNPVLNGSVSATCVQPDGKIPIGGNFSNVNGSACSGLARLNSDGSLDSAFSLSAGTNWIRAIALQAEGKIAVGGRFQEIDSVSRNSFARLNADGTLDSTFDPGNLIGIFHP